MLNIYFLAEEIPQGDSHGRSNGENGDDGDDDDDICVCAVR